MTAPQGPVLVTGASGFAGGHLVEHLRAEGETVVGWDLPDHDLLNRSTLIEAVRTLRPGQVYHCAGAPHVAAAWSETTKTFRANVLATHYLLDALRQAGHACRMLITGSATVYTPSEHALVEDDPAVPNNPYGLSKLAQEQLGLQGGVDDGVEVIVTRSFNHTGPRQRPAFAAPAITRQFALMEAGALEPVLRVGNIDTRRDITDVRDVARAYRLLMQRGTPGTVYNVCSGRAHAIRDIVEGLQARLGRSVEIETNPDLLRRNDTPVILGNPGRLIDTTGWAPAISFGQMLDDLLDYWRQDVRHSA